MSSSSSVGLTDRTFGTPIRCYLRVCVKLSQERTCARVSMHIQSEASFIVCLCECSFAFCARTKRTDLSGLEPARDAVEVEGCAHSHTYTSWGSQRVCRAFGPRRRQHSIQRVLGKERKDIGFSYRDCIRPMRPCNPRMLHSTGKKKKRTSIHSRIIHAHARAQSTRRRQSHGESLR